MAGSVRDTDFDEIAVLNRMPGNRKEPAALLGLSALIFLASGYIAFSQTMGSMTYYAVKYGGCLSCSKRQVPGDHRNASLYVVNCY